MAIAPWEWKKAGKSTGGLLELAWAICTSLACQLNVQLPVKRIVTARSVRIIPCANLKQASGQLSHTACEHSSCVSYRAAGQTAVQMRTTC
jgi:hypothetical protein